MKVIKERRKFNVVITIGLAAAFVAAVIYMGKYYELKTRYEKLMAKQPNPIIFDRRP